jgi:tRNA A-37 threonylcarbamoyl transferase component Bud32
MIDILKRIHARGIFHGDIASRNILLNLQTWKPIFIDFGNAHAWPKGNHYLRDWTRLAENIISEIADSMTPELSEKDIQKLSNTVLLASAIENKEMGREELDDE